MNIPEYGDVRERQFAGAEDFDARLVVLSSCACILWAASEVVGPLRAAVLEDQPMVNIGEPDRGRSVRRRIFDCR